MRWEVVKTAAIGLAATVLLSGCIFANNLSPADISVRDGDLVLAYCLSGEITALKAEQRLPGASWQTVWAGEGEAAVHTGDLLVLDENVRGLDGGHFARLELSEGTTYSVYTSFARRAGRTVGTEFQPVFVAPVGGLREGVWLDSEGGLSERPCAWMRD